MNALLFNEQQDFDASIGQTETLLQITRLSIAVKAALLGARSPIIATLAGIPITKAREVYKDVNGKCPNKGQLPSDTSFYINDVNCHFESAWLAQTYRMLTREGDTYEQSCHCLFLAYERYLLMFKKPAISFDRYFMLIRFTFFSNIIAISNCKECNGIKLNVKNWDPSRVVKCPVCHILHD